MKYTMSAKEVSKNHVMQLAIEGKCTVRQAAERLNLSTRRIKQLKKDFKLRGSQAVIHGNANKQSPKMMPDALVQRIIEVRQTPPYSASNFTHFQELLLRNHKIDIPYTTLHRVLTANGIQSPKLRRAKKSAGHKTRERRGCEGALLQADATPFDWFGDGNTLALHGFIDDAAGNVTGLYLTKNECLMDYLEVLRQTIRNHGIPQALYPDRCGVFFVNPKKNSDISEEANAFLPGFIEQFNELFAVEPAEPFSAYIPLPAHYDLDRLLCAEISRSLSSGSTVKVMNKTFRIEQNKLAVKTKDIHSVLRKAWHKSVG
jgi:hypothetical protein